MMEVRIKHNDNFVGHIFIGRSAKLLIGMLRWGFARDSIMLDYEAETYFNQLHPRKNLLSEVSNVTQI